MTLNQFQAVWKDIRTSIVTIIKANVDLATTKVIGRDAFTEDEATWLGRITAPDNSYHCWSVVYTGTAATDDAHVPTATDIYVPTFRLVGYYGYNFGTDIDNSTDKFQDELNKLRYAFREDCGLSLPSVVLEHTGFKDKTVLGKIAEVPIHIARIDLGVVLHPIPYTPPA